tara:strand:+ start:1069 stop:1440 length:372 start_codon:yes stop_codon:yes gene_type:complete
MATRHGLEVFDEISMTSSDEWITPTSTNYGFYLQGIWTGLVGEAKYKIQASNNGMDWDDYPLCLPIEGVTVLEREIIGTTGTTAIKMNTWFPDYLKVVYDSNTATAGTLTFLLTMINLQDVSG